MQVLRLKKNTDNKIELANITLRTYCLLHNIKINETNTLVMSYFMVYGLNKSTKEMILRSKILNAPNSIENTLTVLRKKGLVKKLINGQNDIIDELKIIVRDKIGIIIQLENI